MKDLIERSLPSTMILNCVSERSVLTICEQQVACFPFDDHNCPQLQQVTTFCQSAYSWLKADIENVVVVHCKAGMARTGLMISCLLLYLKVGSGITEALNILQIMQAWLVSQILFWGLVSQRFFLLVTDVGMGLLCAVFSNL
jgi:protein tyrosine phosphatase